MASPSVETTAKTTTATTSAMETTTLVVSMEEELGQLTSQFKGQCKMIDSEGKFIKTVKLHPENLDIVFNFRLTDKYPSAPAVVEVRSNSLTDDERDDLQTYIGQLPVEMRAHGMAGVVTEALGWLRQEHIDVSGSRRNAKGDENSGKMKKNRMRKNKHKDETTKGKKPPMKTATDVVKRIQWDSAIDNDLILVGYMDRIDGLKEKYFNVFSWEDISTVDYNVLAIPKHRIQYFKYKNEIVWDKRCRLDNVFGSTGSKITITDVIAKGNDVNTNNDNNDQDNYDNGNDGEQLPQAPVRIENEAHDDSDYYDSEDFSDSDSDDSDDGIIVTIDNVASGAVGGYDVTGESKNNFEADDDEDWTGDFDKYWRDKLRPNHFLALRITDDDIRNAAVGIQNQVVASEPRLRDCKIPPGAMHLTLCTVGLETPEQIQNAIDCLKEAHSELKNIVSKDKKLTFKGVQHFFNRVIYGRVVDCPPEFHELVEHLKTCLTAYGIAIRDYHDFVPHMTIMKVSRPVAKMTGNHYIAPWLYSSFNETVLGSQAVDNLHLCAMVDERQADGFYMTAASFDL